MRETKVEPGCGASLLWRGQELLLNRLILPAAARENLAQVLEYEIERVIPLPRDEIFYDYQVRESGQGETGRLAVLVVSVPRRVVRQYVEALEQAGRSAEGGGGGGGGARRLHGVLPRGAGRSRWRCWCATAAKASSPCSSSASWSRATRSAAACAVDDRDQRDGAPRPRRGLPLGRGAGRSPDRRLRPTARRRRPTQGTLDLFALASGRLEAPPDFFDACRADPAARRSARRSARCARGVVDINLLPADDRPGLQEGLFVPLLLVVAIVVLGHRLRGQHHRA